MKGKKAPEATSKKAQGQARKAEAAASKKAAQKAVEAAEEEKKWQLGSKGSSKVEEKAAKAAETARKKAERDALLKAEEEALPSRVKGGKTAVKKTRGLDLSQLDYEGTEGKKAVTLNASNIDDALDALSLDANKPSQLLDRHPERRFKAAYTAYEERRLEEMKGETGLRRQQKIEQIRREFEKHPDNPFNRVNARYDSTREEINQIKLDERKRIEARLAANHP